MTFGKKRKAMGSKSKDNCYELLRFSSSGNIPGIGNKLFKYFKDHYKPIEVISYCDLRWGIGTLYKQMGFALDHISPPNYWYMKDYTTREYRFKYRKDVLVKEGNTKNNTEWRIMCDLGYDRIWDCGNQVWIWK